MENGEWITYTKPQSDSSFEKELADLVQKGIFEETPQGYIIAPSALKTIAEYCHLAQPSP